MKIKALTGIETVHHTMDEDEHGTVNMTPHPVHLKEGEIADVDDKVAARLIKYGHASEDMEAETVLERTRREAAQKQD